MSAKEKSNSTTECCKDISAYNEDEARNKLNGLPSVKDMVKELFGPGGM